MTKRSDFSSDSSSTCKKLEAMLANLFSEVKNLN